MRTKVQLHAVYKTANGVVTNQGSGYDNKQKAVNGAPDMCRMVDVATAAAIEICRENKV
jgi:hypothetical protein